MAYIVPGRWKLSSLIEYLVHQIDAIDDVDITTSLGSLGESKPCTILASPGGECHDGSEPKSSPSYSVEVLKVSDLFAPSV